MQIPSIVRLSVTVNLCVFRVVLVRSLLRAVAAEFFALCCCALYFLRRSLLQCRLCVLPRNSTVHVFDFIAGDS